MQILKSPFNWKNVSFHTRACLTFDHGKASDEIMRYFRRPTDRTEGGGGECRKNLLCTQKCSETLQKKPLFFSAISAGLIWGSSPAMESRNTPGRWKAHHGKGGEADSLGQDTAPNTTCNTLKARQCTCPCWIVSKPSTRDSEHQGSLRDLCETNTIFPVNIEFFTTQKHPLNPVWLQAQREEAISHQQHVSNKFL